MMEMLLIVKIYLILIQIHKSILIIVITNKKLNKISIKMIHDPFIFQQRNDTEKQKKNKIVKNKRKKEKRKITLQRIR